MLWHSCQLPWELSSVFVAMWTENKSPNVSQMGHILFQQQISFFFVLFCFHNWHSFETSFLWHMEFLHALGTRTCVSMKEISLLNSSLYESPRQLCQVSGLPLVRAPHFPRAGRTCTGMELSIVSLVTPRMPFSSFMK